jgi:hypothetical protein
MGPVDSRPPQGASGPGSALPEPELETNSSPSLTENV